MTYRRRTHCSLSPIHGTPISQLPVGNPQKTLAILLTEHGGFSKNLERHAALQLLNLTQWVTGCTLTGLLDSRTGRILISAAYGSTYLKHLVALNSGEPEVIKTFLDIVQNT